MSLYHVSNHHSWHLFSFLLFFGFVLPEHGKTVLSFTSVFYPAMHICHFGDELQIEYKKQCLAVPLSIQCISWEETKCISQSGGNVTVLVIRAFKLAALPKHCQTLCERSEILTALSPLIVGAWEKKMQKLICMISTVKNTAVLTTLLTDSLSFFTLPCGCHDATFIIFFPQYFAIFHFI